MEVGLHLVERPRREAPEVHRYRAFAVKRDALLGIGERADGAVRRLADLERLFYGGHLAAVDAAYAARHGAEIAHGVAQLVGDHAAAARLRELFKRFVHQREGAGAVVIVGVHHGKLAGDHVLSAEYGGDGAIRLRAAFRNGEPIRQRVKALEGVIHVRLSFEPLAAHGAEVFQHLRLENDDEPVKPGALRVVNGVLHEDLSAGADLFDLLRPAVARGEPRGHDNECCGHESSPFAAKTDEDINKRLFQDLRRPDLFRWTGSRRNTRNRRSRGRIRARRPCGRSPPRRAGTPC